MKSKSLSLYHKDWLQKASPESIAFVDAVYELCERNYEVGGDAIVECFEPEDVIEMFTTLDDVKEHIGLRLESASNCRWGSDDDPELKALERFESQWED